jgi:hypothetical protein
METSLKPCCPAVSVGLAEDGQKRGEMATVWLDQDRTRLLWRSRWSNYLPFRGQSPSGCPYEVPFRAQTYQLFAPGPGCGGLLVPRGIPASTISGATYPRLTSRAPERRELYPGINTVRSDTLLERKRFEPPVRPSRNRGGRAPQPWSANRSGQPSNSGINQLFLSLPRRAQRLERSLGSEMMRAFDPESAPFTWSLRLRRGSSSRSPRRQRRMRERPL